MTVERYHGVLCAWCHQPIAISQAIVRRVENESAPLGFTCRCKACDHENIYHATDIQTFEGKPRIRPLRYGTANA
jgi:RNase P subunit RPR2